MKAISLWQPWASLMALGLKTVETRSWETSYKGPLAIQAAKRRVSQVPGLIDMIRNDWPFWRNAARVAGWPIDESRQLIGFGSLPYGAILAVTKLVKCYRTPRVEVVDRDDSLLVSDPPTVEVPVLRSFAISPTERAFGDYSPGRFAWVTRDTNALPSPVPFTGRQGLFEVPDELVLAKGKKSSGGGA